MNPSDDKFLGLLRKQLQYAIQWLPKGAIGPMQVRPSATVGQVLTTTVNGAEWQDNAGGGGVSDHGALTGLADDDHSQYHNDTRGDARYWQLSTDLATQAELDAHLNDTTDAHDASAISITDAAGDFTATDVEGALAELQADAETDATALSDHIADATAAHAGTAISNTPAGNIAATTVQAAINELDGEKQPLDADLTTIAGLTATTDNFLQAKSSAWASRTPAQVATDLQAAGLAPLASPTFTGTPSLPTGSTGVTQAENDASTKISTTAYVDRATGNASSARPAVSVYKSGTQSLSTSSETLVTFDSENYDTDTMHDTSTNAGRLVASSTGTYVITGCLNFAANATGYRYAMLRKNAAGSAAGGTLIDYFADEAATASTSQHVNFSKSVQLTAGDYIEVFGWQNSGGSLNLNATYTNMQMVWVGGTGAAWGNAGVRAYRSTTQNITTGAGQAVLWDAETFDIDGLHSTSSNTSRITCVTPGTYQFSGALFYSSNATGQRGVLYRTNGSGDVYAAFVNATAANGCVVPYSFVVSLVAGDYIEIIAEQNSGSTLTLSATHSYVGAVRVGYQTNPSKDGQMVTGGRVIRTSTWTTGALATSATSSPIESITVTGDGVNRMEIVASGWNYLASAANPFYFQLYDSTGGVGIGAADQQPPVVNTRACGHVVADLAPFTGSKTIQLRVVNYTAGGITVQADGTSITSAKPARIVAKWIPA